MTGDPLPLAFIYPPPCSLRFVVFWQHQWPQAGVASFMALKDFTVFEQQCVERLRLGGSRCLSDSAAQR